MPRAALSDSCILDGQQKGGKHGADHERQGHRGEDYPLLRRPVPDRPGGCRARLCAGAPTRAPSHAPGILARSGWTAAFASPRRWSTSAFGSWSVDGIRGAYFPMASSAITESASRSRWVGRQAVGLDLGRGELRGEENPSIEEKFTKPG